MTASIKGLRRGHGDGGERGVLRGEKAARRFQKRKKITSNWGEGYTRATQYYTVLEKAELHCIQHSVGGSW